MKKSIMLLIILSICSINVFSQWVTVPSAPTGYLQDIMQTGGVIYIGSSGGGVYKSFDNGISWQQFSNGLNNSQALDVHQVVKTLNGDLFAATTGGIYKSTDDGAIWTKKSNGITIGPGALYEFCESIFEHNGNLFTGAYNGLYISTDHGENWMLTNVSGEGIQAKNFVEHNGILFAARESINSPIGYKSLDGGLSWIDLTGLSFFNTITFFSEPSKLWVGTIDGVWLSTDDGENWTARNNGLSADPYSSSIIRVNGNLITALKFGGSGIYMTTDDGLNWSDFGDGLPFLSNIFKLLEFDNRIFAVTSDGLWQRDISQVPVELSSFTASVSGNDVLLKWETASETNNKGFEIQRSDFSDQKSFWKEVGFVDGFGTSTEKHTYQFKDQNLNAGTYSYRLKQIDFNGIFEYSSIVNVSVETAEQFQLSQNYPNPFNPVTVINYQLTTRLPARQVNNFVNLKVYDLLGNEVKTLVNEQKKPGRYSVKFDGSKLSSGIYYYKLTAGSYTSVKKMMLLK